MFYLARNFLLGSLVALLTGTMLAQEQSDRRSFEVASVKPNKSTSTERGSGFQPGGRFIARNMTVRMLIALAFGDPQPIATSRVVGGPNWIDREGFDIEAKSDDRTGSGFPPNGPLMIRDLLAERFKLVTHTTSRETAAYALVKARNDGPKLRRPTIECVEPPQRRDAAPTQRRPYCRALLFDGKGHLTGASATMPWLAKVLSNRLGRPVTDETGLDGIFDLELEFTTGLSVAPDVSTASDLPATGPSIYTALQEQLGLKLESRRGQVDVVVVDSVEHPTED